MCFICFSNYKNALLFFVIIKIHEVHMGINKLIITGAQKDQIFDPKNGRAQKNPCAAS